MEIVKTDPHLFMHKASKSNAIIAGEMADEIKAVIYKRDNIPLALAIGVLDIVKKELMDNA